MKLEELDKRVRGCVEVLHNCPDEYSLLVTCNRKNGNSGFFIGDFDSDGGFSPECVERIAMTLICGLADDMQRKFLTDLVVKLQELYNKFKEQQQ